VTGLKSEVDPTEFDPAEVESDLKELESKVEASEDKDAEAKASGPEVALEKIADRRSNNLHPGIVFHGTDASEQEVEPSVPKVKALTVSEIDSEPETDGEPGWGSGSSKQPIEKSSAVCI
jgi:hypothetical protein